MDTTHLQQIDFKTSQLFYNNEMNTNLNHEF